MTKSKNRLDSKNSISEPDLATAGWSKSGFPPGITVDELWLYRRKRPSADLRAGDNLKLREGSFKALKTEYKRRFKNFYQFGSDGDLRKEISPVRAGKPEDSIKVEGLREFRPLYNESYVEYPVEVPLRFKPEKSSFGIDFNENEMKENPSETERLLSEIRSKYIKYPNIERAQLLKRPTNLKLEGDFYTTTEKAEKFIEYLLSQRPELMRKPTTLKLEGEMDTTTENRDKFVPFEVQSRPPLCKKLTNLHLEGDLNILTEKQEKFVPHEPQTRPPLIKKRTNLNIEGSLDLLPEYRKEFVEFKAERRKLALPVNNLKTDGFFDPVSDVSTPFQQQMHPQIPHLRETDEEPRARGRKRESLRPEGQMETTTESKTQFVEKAVPRTDRTKVTNNLQLEGRIDLNPEYRNAYIDFNKDGRVSPSRAKRRDSHLKTEGRMETRPEYSSSYVDFPRKRPQLRRPDCSLSSEGELDHMTEKREKFVPFPQAPRTGPLKREPELKLEGDFECQPEYRKAYIDYLVRERVERKSRPLDNLGRQPKRIIEEEPVEKTTLAHLPLPQREEVLPSVKVESSATAASRPSTSKEEKPANMSLSQIETCAFGPKLTVPAKKAPSRSSSPAPSDSSKRKSKKLPSSRNASPTCRADSDVPSQKTRKFGNPVRVENLAYKSATPALPLIDVTAKNKWMRDSSVESTSAFVVLDKNVDSNYVYDDRNRRLRGRDWTNYWSSQQ